MLPSAPTDNLYKFVTFLGIALSVFCAWSLNDALKRVEIAQIETLIREMKDAQKKVQFDSFVDNKREQLDQLPQDNQAERNKVIDELTDETVRYAEQTFSDILTSIPDGLRTGHSHRDVLYYEIGMIFGFVMAIAGIAFWYFLHQRYQDAILRIQLQNITADTENAAT